MHALAGGLGAGAEPGTGVSAQPRSLYKALARGEVDDEAMRDLLVEHRPSGWPLVFAVDASTWPRCDAETSPERGFYYSASKHSAGQPIVAGWSYQWIAQLDWAADSWTAPMDARRIPVGSDTTTVTVAQVTDLTGGYTIVGSRIGSPVAATPQQGPMFVFDAGYDPIALTDDLGDVAATIVVRIRDDRVFDTDPAPTEPGAVGRPRRHGDRFSCANGSTWPAPDAQLHAEDRRYGTVHVQAWNGLHPKLAGRGRWTHHDALPIVAGPSSESTSNTYPNPPRAPKRRCGCGLPAQTRSTSTPAGEPTCAASISNTPSGSASTPSGGPPHDCVPPNKPTGGPGPSPPPTPNFGSPDPWSPTSDCPGRNPPSQANSPPPCPARVSTPCRNPGHARQPTKTQQGRPRPSQRDPPQPTNPPPSDQENRLTRFNRKLRVRLHTFFGRSRTPVIPTLGAMPGS